MRSATGTSSTTRMPSRGSQDSRTRLCVSRKPTETDLREKSLPPLLCEEKRLPELKRERHLSEPERYPELQERIRRNVRESLDQSRR